MHRKDAGFTLIEAVMGMAVLVILITVAIPSMGALLEHQRSSAAMNALVVHMSQARMSAITYRHPAILCPSADGAGCDAGGDWGNGWILFIDRNDNRRLDAGDDLLRIDPEPRGRHLRLVGTRGRPQLRYLPDGRSAGTNLTIHVCNRRGEKVGAVIVNNAGRPRTERPGQAASCPG